MSNPGYDNFIDYYKDSPQIILRDFNGDCYQLLTTNFNGNEGKASAYPSGGTNVKDSDKYSYSNGKAYGNFPGKSGNNNLWDTTYKIFDWKNDYTRMDRGIIIPGGAGSNADSYNSVYELSKQGDLPGYVKTSTGECTRTSSVNSANYIQALTPGNKPFYSFSVYVKKNSNDFFKDMYTLNPNKFRSMIITNQTRNNVGIPEGAFNKVVCDDTSQPLNLFNSAGCSSSQIDNWCNVIPNIFPNNNASIPPPSMCDNSIRNGKINNTLTNLCNNNQAMGTQYCKNIINKVSPNTNSELFNNLTPTWCKISSNLNSRAGELPVPTQCYETVNSGSMDSYLQNICDRDSMGSVFCKDVYTNPNLKISPAVKSTLTNNWCKVNNNLNPGNLNSAVVPSQCYSTVTSGSMDEYITKQCTPANMGTKFCNDIFTNPSYSLTTNLRNVIRSNAGSYCNNDNTITTPECSMVYNDCSQLNAAFDDTTIPYYKCNSLINKLTNETTKNKLLSKSDLSKLDANLSTYQKKSIISGFNNVGSNIVEASLCALATNANDPSCASFQSNNFSALINTNDNNPVLIMYFTDDGSKTPFAIPAGMDFHNSLSFTSFPNNLSYFNTKPKYTLTPLWYAKFYVYLSPSATDQYLFSVNAMTDAKVYLNNTLIINAWNNTVPTSSTLTRATSSAYITLSPSNGPYLLYIEYRNITSTANVQISYVTKTAPTIQKLLDPTSVLRTSIVGSSTVYSPSNPPPATTPTIWISKFNPFLLAQTAQEIQTINYCNTNNRFATDPECTGTAQNSFNGINKTYTSNIKNKNNADFQKTMLDYCSDPKYDRFATDATFCGSDNYQSYLLKPTNGSGINEQMQTRLKTYCSNPVNNKYTTPNAQNYCRTTDNINNLAYTSNGANLKMLPGYADAIRGSRMKYMTDSLQNSLSTNATPVPISQDVLDYLTADYPIIQKNTALSNDTNISAFDQSIMNYCSDPRYNRFATDGVYCNNSAYKKNILNNSKSPDQTLLKSMGDYCLNPNNQEYCRTVDKENNKNYTTNGANLPMNIKYADAIRTNRFNYVQNSINEAMNSNNTTPGEIKQDIIDYISIDYPEIQSNNDLRSLYPNDKLLTTNIYPYCENVPDYKKNKLCSTLYTKYASDPNVQASIARINEFNYGISSNAFMGKSTNSVSNTTYSTARDSPDAFAKFLPYVLNYCETGDNIISKECQDYYKNVSNTINNGLAAQYKANSTYKTPTLSASTIDQINAAGATLPIPTIVPTIVSVSNSTTTPPMLVTVESTPTTTPSTNIATNPTTAPINVVGTVTTTPPTNIVTSPSAVPSSFSNRNYNNCHIEDDYMVEYKSNWLYHIILFMCLVILITMVMKLVKCKQRNIFKPSNSIFDLFKY